MRKSAFAAFLTLAVALAALIAPPAPAFAKTVNDRLVSATKAVREMSTQKDVETMADLVKGAKGVVIIPSYVKAAIGLGGAYGEGVVLRHDPATGRWYGPSFMNIAGASYGLQIGLQSTALLLVVTNQRGMERFYGDKVKLGADIDIAAGPVGRSAGAATDVNLKASIYSYSMSKGLFAGLSLGGAVMSTDEKANTSYWGAKYNPRTILDKPASASNVQPLLTALNELKRKAGK
ncbi:MAG: lipid-binding SYLF domain-containing protein [Synergistales bacterium]|jgi:lipid-binding SYLF domain-containing protein